nr:hypothetical protein [Streptomyces galilaeus]
MSYVLNNRADQPISEETRRRVLEAARTWTTDPMPPRAPSPPAGATSPCCQSPTYPSVQASAASSSNSPANWQSTA